MSKSIGRTIITYAKNVGRHVSAVVTRKESAEDAFKRVSKDTKKLSYQIRPEGPGDRKKAIKLTQKGRERYNERNYSQAEEYLRRAMRADSQFALAYTYMGHTLYKLNRIDEAIHFWERASDLDPKAEAGSKARKKLQMLENQRRETVAELERDIQNTQGHF